MEENNKTHWMKELEQFEPDLFWEKHGRQIMWITVAVLGVVVLGFLWQRQKSQEEDTAALRLAMAYDTSSLQSLAQENQGRDIGAIAQLRLADVFFREGNYAKAIEAYEQLLKTSRQNLFTDQARLGLAASQESMGKLAEAKALYQQIANQMNSYTSIAGRMGAARCAEALGQKDEARHLYMEATQYAQGSAWQQEAMIRYKVLARDQKPVTTTPPISNVPPGLQLTPSPTK